MEDLIKNPTKVRYWKEIDRYGEMDWQSLFDGYQSAVDFPTFGYNKDILQVYPDGIYHRTTAPGVISILGRIKFAIRPKS